MTLRLKPDLHWCVCAGRVVLLDLKADRYFCVPAGVDEAFLRAAEGDALPDDRNKLQALLDRGLVLDQGGVGGGGGGARPATRTIVAEADGDLFGEALPRANAWDLLTVVVLQARAALQLRRQPLSVITRHVAAEGEAASRRPPGGLDRLLAIVSAFAASSLALREADRCLARALAAHAACCREGIAPKLVLGVQLDPFRAHAWVQLGTRVLIGDYEQVRLFTPIAVLG
jgi:hypothetical protein